MFTHNDGIPAGRKSSHDKANILLVGGGDSEIFRTKLSLTPDLPYTIWHSRDAEDAADFLREQDVRIEIAFLDLSSPGVDYPKELFLRLKAVIGDIPVIVLTDRTDYDMIHFVLRAGAADTVSQWQIRSDLERLKSVIEACDARHKVSARTQEKNRADNNDTRKANAAGLHAAAQTAAAVLVRTQENDASALRISQENSAAALRQAQERHLLVLRETQKQAATALVEANDKRSTDMRYYIELYSLMGGQYSTPSENASLESDILREKQQRVAAAIDRIQLQDAADYRDAGQAAAAALKARQETDAIELKKNQFDAAEKLRDTQPGAPLQ